LSFDSLSSSLLLAGADPLAPRGAVATAAITLVWIPMADNVKLPGIETGKV